MDERITRIEPADSVAPGPGAAPVGVIGIILIKLYLVVATLLCLYALIALWPAISPAKTAAAEPSQVTLFLWTFTIYDEVRLLLLVILAGALGSLVQALRSIYWYVGNRELVKSWLGKYLLQPFAGSALALIFYVVVRGGFFSPQAKFDQTSPFGFTALSAMVGLFSEQAVLKLKQVAETVLAKPGPGKNPHPQKDSTTP